MRLEALSGATLAAVATLGVVLAGVLAGAGAANRAHARLSLEASGIQFAAQEGFDRGVPLGQIPLTPVLERAAQRGGCVRGVNVVFDRRGTVLSAVGSPSLLTGQTVPDAWLAIIQAEANQPSLLPSVPTLALRPLVNAFDQIEGGIALQCLSADLSQDRPMSATTLLITVCLVAVCLSMWGYVVVYGGMMQAIGVITRMTQEQRQNIDTPL